MNITIHKNGQQLGPFTESQVGEMLKSGQLALEDLAWAEGMEEWKPLSSFENLQSLPAQTPPPAAGQVAPPSNIKKTEPLAIWSLVLGIVSLVACGIFAGIPAVICGHIGRSRIRRNPSLDGGGMALAGLITGYISIVILPLVLASLAIPALAAAQERAKARQTLSNMTQIHLALQTAALDATTDGDKKVGWPADAKMKSKADVKQMLISKGYLKAEELDKLHFDKISVGNVSEEDPSDTIVLQCKTDSGKFTLVARKSGEVLILRPGQSPGNPPSRTPAFLE